MSYRVQVAVVGDVSRFVTASRSLADFVRESNEGTHVWFVRDLAELRARLTA